MNLDQATIIGVDGGASRVRALAVDFTDYERRSTCCPIGPEFARAYPAVPGFVPLPAAEQLVARERGSIDPRGAEDSQGRLWVEAAADVIVDVARARDARLLVVGVGMPGLKTADGRGIAVLNNGPRIPRYLDALQAALQARRLDLAAPIGSLGSDAAYCGVGEQHLAAGGFRGVRHAYYLGGGTGLADALKLEDRLLSFDAVAGWMLKAWQIPSALGPQFESVVSASGLNRVYARLAGTHGPHAATIERGVLPEVAAASGDPIACAWLDTVAIVVSELLFERLWTVKNGRADAPHRGSEYQRLDAQHPYRGVVLERLIVGQQLGRLLSGVEYGHRMRAVLSDGLAARIAAADDDALRRACLEVADAAPCSARLRSDLIRVSQLPSAAVGAAVAAVQALGAS